MLKLNLSRVYLDLFFLSAICVTGLIVQDTAKYFADIGKTVILILIQLGGLGIMTVGSIFGLILGRKILIKDKFYIDSSFFQVVTARTAGFNTLNIGKLTQFSLFFLTILMFIGASPGGTGGGIKTTTFAVVTAGALSSIRGRSQVILFKKKLPAALISRALTVTFTAMVLIVLSTIGVLIFEKCTLTQAIFEVTSAFGTVGLSTGITLGLTSASKIILIICMYIGRIGISTLALAIGMRSYSDRIIHPEESVTIG